MLSNGSGCPIDHDAGFTAATAVSGPRAGELPVTRGSLVEFQADLLNGLFALHREWGPIAALEDNGQRVLFLFDAAYNRQVLSDTQRFHAHFFALRGPKRSSQRRVTCGLLAMNGEQHKRNRRMVKQPFGPKAIAGYRSTIAELAAAEVALWRDGEQADFNERMIRYMLKVTSRILFGLEEPRLAYELGEQIARWVQLNNDLGVHALAAVDGFAEGYEELLAFAGELEANVLELIRRRRERPDPEAVDVLSILVRSHDEAGGLSDEELVGQCCVLFAAAHMTTAHSFSWTTFLLAQHPSVMQTLWGAIHDGTADEPQPAGGPPLLERIINESLRVMPASAYSQRIAAETVTIGPFEVERGMPIVFTPLVTHRLPTLCKDPTRFDPNRWLTLRPSAYAYHPFGAGPRRCIGGPLAIEVLRTSLPIFLRDWRLLVAPDAVVEAEVKSTMLNPRRGVPMVFERHTATGGDGGFVASPVSGNVGELVRLDEAPQTSAPRRPR